MIAKLIHRDRSVVTREIKRNSGDYFPYNARTAEEAANRRAKKTNKKKLDKNHDLYLYVEKSLKKGWSPQQIAGRLKAQPPPKLKNKSISHEQIYQYIYAEGLDLEGLRLYRYLRKKKPRRQKRYYRKTRKQTILGRISINLRPEEINQKSSYGHWESDSMICKQRRAVSVQYERRSQLVRINKLANHSAEETLNAIEKSIDSLPEYLFRSITFDNGSENAGHLSLGIETYFCRPYSPWQKGGVENMNGLIREYLPRKAELDRLTIKDLKMIENKLNNRPRKSLNYLSPNEIIKQQIGALNS